jgi:hypothetical protein
VLNKLEEDVREWISVPKNQNEQNIHAIINKRKEKNKKNEREKNMMKMNKLQL